MKSPSHPTFRPSVSTLALGLVALSLLPGIARAQTITQGRVATYSGSNLSVWGPGRAQGNNLRKILIGPDISIPYTKLGAIGELIVPSINLGLITIPSFSLGKTGAQVTFNGQVKAGITFQPWYDGGRLSYEYRAAVDITYPRASYIGQPVTITARRRTGYGNFTATSPSFGGNFGAVGQIKGRADTEAWFLGAKLFGGNVFNVDESPAEKSLGSVTFDVPDSVNAIIAELNGALNPIPIGVEIFRPDAETHAAGVAADGSMSATAFGKFLSVETDVLDWVLALFPPPISQGLSRVKSGNYPVPATNYKVQWDFLKTWANLDVGIYSDHKLYPNPNEPTVVRLQVYNARTNALLADTTSGTVTLTQMPADGLRVIPTITTKLKFRNRLSLGTGGSIGTEPIHILAQGSFGSGSRRKSLDFDFSVGKFVWEGEPTAGTKLLEDDFSLPEPVGGWTRDLGPVGILAYDGVNLPSIVYGGYNGANPAASEPAAVVPAFSYDQATGDIDRDRKEVVLNAELGRTFFANNATVSVTLVKRVGDTTTRTPIQEIQVRDTFVRLQMPTALLSPGQHTLEMRVDSRNSQNQAVGATYFVPLTCYNPRVSVSPALNSRQDLDVRTVINRVEANGQPTTIYLGGAKGILPTTQMILDGETVLPNDWSTKSERDLAGQFSNGLTIGFTLSAALKDEMAGAKHIVKLRAPSLIRAADGTLLPPFESQDIPVFVVAGRPTISGLSYNDAPTTTLPFGKGDLSFDLKGTNFSKATKVYFNWTGSDPSDAELIQASYTNSGAMRIRLGEGTTRSMHERGVDGFTLRAETPVENVPADAGHIATTSGGSSGDKTFKLVYPVPALNRIGNVDGSDDAPVYLRNLQSTVRVYGDGLYGKQIYNGNNPATVFRLGGTVLTATQGPLNPDGLTVPYFDVVLPARDATGEQSLTATNLFDRRSLEMTVSAENGKPGLSSVGTANRVRITGAAGTVAIAGGPIYGDTILLIGNQTASLTRLSDSSATANLSAFSATPGKTTVVSLRNNTPGGGDSDPITVILEEGNVANFTVTKGVLAYDRASGAWKQEITLRYNGTRTLPALINLQFRNLPGGIQLLNGNGTDNGAPYARIKLGETTATVKFVALFRKTGTAAITFDSVLRIP